MANELSKSLLAYTCKITGSIFIIIACISSGCALYNRSVSPENRITLALHSVQQGTYSQGFHAVHYAYIIDGNRMKIEGSLSGKNFHTMSVKLLLLDKNGQILQTTNVYYSGYRMSSQYGTNKSFSTQVQLPLGTTSISFDFFAEYRQSRSE